MSPTVVFRHLARAELRSAVRWHEHQRAGLGTRFVGAVEQAIKTAVDVPMRATPLMQNIRRVRVRRFPYFVYYIAEESRLIVLAVLHYRRDPEKWRHR
ncbi:MAG: type II toxin-antitoxin system RelE/ParE family toxin [Pseudomonadota bacterium]